jgi:hypothetical protein
MTYLRSWRLSQSGISCLNLVKCCSAESCFEGEHGGSIGSMRGSFHLNSVLYCCLVAGTWTFDLGRAMVASSYQLGYQTGRCVEEAMERFFYL